MGKVLSGFVTLIVCLITCSLLAASDADKKTQSLSENSPTYVAPSGPKEPNGVSSFDIDRIDRIEAAVVHPYKSANVGVEVKGAIDKINFEEGDPVAKDATVVEISPDRYKLLVKKAAERVKGLELSQKNAEDDLKIKEDLFSLNAGTQQDVTKARTQFDIEKHRLLEAREELKLAEMDLQSCMVKAPFSGFLAVRYKQPDEVVNQYDNVFALIDKSKVYAVANVPESQVHKFVKGAKTLFAHGSGKKYEGAVDKVGVLVDPQSKTLKVHVLIDNTSGDLQVGATGSLELVE
jgi:RND family efflux transporter MFP subunit